MTCPRPVLVLLVAAVAACTAPTGKGGERQVGSVLPPVVQAAFPHLTARAFHAHLAYLSDDLLEGRGTATRGHQLAAKYMAAQFERIGLQPGGDRGTYFQQVPLREATIAPRDSHLVIVRRMAPPDVLRFGRDFITVGPVSEPLNVEAPVVFVNHGVVAPGRHEDDYAGVDVTGKIVAVLLGGPSGVPPVERAYFEDAGRVPQRRTARWPCCTCRRRLWSPPGHGRAPSARPAFP